RYEKARVGCDSSHEIHSKWQLNKQSRNCDSEWILIPPNHQTRAELVITEDEYDGCFRVESIIEGSVVVNLRSKKDGSIVCPIFIGNMSEVLTPEHGFQPVPESPGAVIFVNEGRCLCNFGISQHVEMHQTPIHRKE
ncbi:unnamed protein product, partial [Protopolystoma xenopodis]